MLFEVIKERIQKGVSAAEKLASKNLSLPILECVYIKAENNLLTINSTNLDVGVSVKIPAKVQEAGIIAVPAKVLNSCINNIGSEETMLCEVKDNTLHIKTKTSSSTIKTFIADDFPIIPTIEGEHILTITSELFNQAVSSVIFAGSNTTIKPELSSVSISITNNSLTCAATDSFRLAEKKIKVDGMEGEYSLLVPIKNMHELLRIISIFPDELQISWNKNQIVIQNKSFYAVSRIVDGSFPDYTQIIPKDFSAEAIVLKQDVSNSLKFVNIFSDKFNQVELKTSSTNKTLTINTKNTDVGEHSDTLSATIKGKDVDLKFNHRYIADAMPIITSQSISFGFNENGRPLLIKSADDESFTYIVMPMNK